MEAKWTVLLQLSKVHSNMVKYTVHRFTVGTLLRAIVRVCSFPIMQNGFVC